LLSGSVSWVALRLRVLHIPSTPFRRLSLIALARRVPGRGLAARLPQRARLYVHIDESLGFLSASSVSLTLKVIF
jgi:hypothetical protein